MKKHLLFLFIVLLFSCNQETLILLRNLDRAEWITIEDILKESGLAQQESTLTTNQISRKPSTPPQPQNIPQETKYMTIPQQKDFIIQLPADNNFLVTLKSTSGIQYLKENSDPVQKTFAFRSGTTNGRAYFQYYDLDGRLVKNLFYYFQVHQAPSAPITNIPTRKPQLASTEANEQTNITTPPTKKDNIDWLLSSIAKLPHGEAIKNLESATADPAFSDSEKEHLNYTLIEYYLKQRLFTSASNRIETLQDSGYKAYYRGLYYEKLQKPTKALENLLTALDTGGSVLPLAIVATGRLMLNAGVSDSLLTSRLDSLTAGIKDPNLAAQSMIQLGNLYEGLRNISRAKELYLAVINGNYSNTWKKRAKEALSLLEKQF